jgi:hypothetical protein
MDSYNTGLQPSIREDKYKEDKNNSSSSSSDDDPNYIIETKVCNKLSISKQFEINEVAINIDDSITYDPLKTYSLENNNIIIPEYYELHKHPSKILSFDYFNMITDNIRNFRTLHP